MRAFLVLMTLFICLFSAQGQSVKSMKRSLISSSGCSLYNYCDTKYKIDYSADSSKVYTGECINGNATFGVICIKLLHPVDDLSRAEELMIKYLDYLKENFEINDAAGYASGYYLNNNEQTRGIVDYWTDKDLDNWKVKAWTNGKYISVMYVYSSSTLNEATANVFLDGFRFPVK